MTRTNWQGDLVAVNPGVAYVTVRTYNGKEATCKVTVKKAPSKVSLNISSVTLGVGEKYKLSAVLPEGTASALRTFSTSNSNMLLMTRTSWEGEFKAIVTGTTYVTVRLYNGKTASCKVTVRSAPYKVSLNKTALTLGVGETYSLSAVIPDDTAAAKRTFRTSNSSIVNMTKTNWTGSFKAMKPGTAWVTVRLYNGKEASCKITVKAAPSRVSLSKSNLTLTVGQSATLYAIVPSGTAATTRNFRSSNSSIVKMTNTSWTGSFKAMKAGTAWVTVRLYNGKEASCKVTVVNKPAPQPSAAQQGFDRVKNYIKSHYYNIDSYGNPYIADIYYIDDAEMFISLKYDSYENTITVVSRVKTDSYSNFTWTFVTIDGNKLNNASLLFHYVNKYDDTIYKATATINPATYNKNTITTYSISPSSYAVTSAANLCKSSTDIALNTASLLLLDNGLSIKDLGFKSW